MKIKNYIYCVVLIFILISTVVLSRRSTIVIGFSQCTGGDWREQMNNEMLSEIKFYDNVDLIIKNADGDINQQINDVRGLIDDNVDLLVISPIEDSRMVQEFNHIDFENIPIVLIDRNLSSNKHIVYIGASNLEVGQKAAEYILNKRGDEDTDIVLIRGYELSTPTTERQSGFVNTLSAYPNFQIKTIISGKDLDGQKLYETTKIIQENIDYIKNVDVVYAFNDAMAAIVYDELSKMKLPKHPIIIGVDGQFGYGKGINAVQKGKIDVSIVYPTCGEKAIETVMQILQKRSVPKEVLLPTTLINIDNVSAYYQRSIELIEQQQKKDLLYNKYAKQSNLLRALYVVIVLLLLYVVGYYLFNKIRSRKYTVENETDGGDSTIAQPDNFKAIIDELIAKHYTEYDLDGNQFIEKIAISRINFYKKFKDIYDDTPNNYLRNYRLDKSKKLILSKTYNISEIAYKVGFSSPAYYTKCFKKRFKCTPSEYELMDNNKK